MSYDTPHIFNTLMRSIYIMENKIIKLSMLKANITICHYASHIKAFEFYKGKEPILEGYQVDRNILPKLQRLIG